MIVSLLTGAGLFNISDFVPALARLDLQGVQAKLRRVHHQFDGLITKLLVEHAATAARTSSTGSAPPLTPAPTTMTRVARPSPRSTSRASSS
jgi:hypothetical protein